MAQTSAAEILNLRLERTRRGDYLGIARDRAPGGPLLTHARMSHQGEETGRCLFERIHIGRMIENDIIDQALQSLSAK